MKNTKKNIFIVAVLMIFLVGAAFYLTSQSKDQKYQADYKLNRAQIIFKNSKISPEQKEKLTSKVEQIKKQPKSAETVSLIKQFQENKIDLAKLDRTFKNEEDLGKIESILKEQPKLIKNINENIKKDFDMLLAKSLSDKELEMIDVEPNYIFALQSQMPDDLSFETSDNTENQELDFNDLHYNKQWALEFIGKSDDDQTKASSKMIVAIIDTGVDYDHEDLQGQIWSDADCVNEFNEAVSGGCMRGGYDFVDDDDDPFASDGYAHGTAVAGLIAANTNNKKGIASISNNAVEIMILRCADDGVMDLDNIISAINFAVNNGADIVNMSFGGPTFSNNLKAAIEYAGGNDVLVVAAAGNYASDNDLEPIYPAAFALENVIAVSALNKAGNLAYFSNYGHESVDIAAPGVDILTTVPGDEYESVSGTSYAAPLVSGVLSSYVD